MSESVSSSDFFLGIEEYLTYLGHIEHAQRVHSLVRTLSSDDKQTLTVKAFLQDFSADAHDVDRASSDLMHSIVKSDSFEHVYRSVMLYLSKKLLDDKDIQDFVHSINKADSMAKCYSAVLQLVGKTVENDHGMNSLALAMHRALNSNQFEDDFIKSYLSMLDGQYVSDKIFRGVNNYLKAGYDKSTIIDAFSRSQIKSKIWLVEELENIRQKLPKPVYKHVVIFAGWYGQLKFIYDKKLTYRKIRNIEMNRSACEASDYIFNLSELENYKVKAVNANINELTLHKNGYEWDVENFRNGTKYSEKFLPDLIINTSAEHMTEDWFFQIKFKELESDPIVAIQSNNLFDIHEHINCVHSVDHMKKKFPMREILYEGELQLKGYKRVMLIGKP